MKNFGLQEEEKKIKLGFYPYTYVRTTAMKSLLIKKDEYHKLLKMSIAEITKFMQDSSCKKEINELAPKHSGMYLLELALTRNMASSFKKLRKISPEELQLVIDEYIKRNDIQDIKTILRGKFSGVEQEEIISSLTGSGTLELDYLNKLVEMEIPDILNNLKIIKFKNLEKAYKDFQDLKSLSPIENTLDKYYYSGLLDFTYKLPVQGKAFRNFLRKEIEVINLVNLVRLKREKIDKNDIAKYLIFSGEPIKNLKLKKLLEIDDVIEIMKRLEKEEYGEQIKECIEDFEKNNSLIKFENTLYKYLLKKSTSMMHINPLSIDVILSYMFAKEIETRNLRLLLRGKQLDLKEEFIESQLIA